MCVGGGAHKHLSFAEQALVRLSFVLSAAAAAAEMLTYNNINANND